MDRRDLHEPLGPHRTSGWALQRPAGQLSAHVRQQRCVHAVHGRGSGRCVERVAARDNVAAGATCAMSSRCTPEAARDIEPQRTCRTVQMLQLSMDVTAILHKWKSGIQVDCMIARRCVAAMSSCELLHGCFCCRRGRVTLQHGDAHRSGCGCIEVSGRSVVAVLRCWHLFPKVCARGAACGCAHIGCRREPTEHRIGSDSQPGAREQSRARGAA